MRDILVVQTSFLCTQFLSGWRKKGKIDEKYRKKCWIEYFQKKLYENFELWTCRRCFYFRLVYFLCMKRHSSVRVWPQFYKVIHLVRTLVTVAPIHRKVASSACSRISAVFYWVSSYTFDIVMSNSWCTSTLTLSNMRWTPTSCHYGWVLDHALACASLPTFNWYIYQRFTILVHSFALALASFFCGHKLISRMMFVLTLDRDEWHTFDSGWLL